MSRPPGLRLAWARVPDGMPRRDASRGLLRRLAPDVRFTRRCPTCGSADHGPLRADGDAFLASVTYAGGLAIVGVVDADAVTDEPLGQIGLWFSGVGAGRARVRRAAHRL
ncbi:MAG: hypothetical protein J0I70_00970, partial [Microbacterium sp.]|nr:hypothetical protein [Microbacterium sp.]